MKRKVVQHGPSTLTLSLPARWVREQGIAKGDEVHIAQIERGLLLTTEKYVSKGTKRLSVRGLGVVVPRALASLYKAGYDEIIIEYDRTEQLSAIHETLNSTCIGFEVVSEMKGEVVIHSVSEPSKDEFKTLFRRIFHFILSVADDGYDAAKTHDTQLHKDLVLRDLTINKLSDFCRRIVNKKGQDEYDNDAILYHVIEQLEKIGDSYRDINIALQDGKKRLTAGELETYAEANKLLRRYEDLFFGFSIEKMDRFLKACRMFDTRGTHEIEHTLNAIVTELYNLTGSTMVLHL